MKITILSYEETKERLKNEPLRIYSPQRYERTTKSSQKKVDGPSVPSPVEETPLDQRWGPTKSTTSLTKSRRQQ